MNTAPPPSRVRICVLDDDESFRRLSQTILRNEGYECHLIHDFANAVDLITSVDPQLIMMDLRLGQDVEGVQLLLDLKSDGATTADIPVLICTAARDLLTAHHQVLEEYGCIVVEKPFNLDDLTAAISQCLASRQP